MDDYEHNDLSSLETYDRTKNFLLIINQKEFRWDWVINQKEIEREKPDLDFFHRLLEKLYLFGYKIFDETSFLIWYYFPFECVPTLCMDSLQCLLISNTKMHHIFFQKETIFKINGTLFDHTNKITIHFNVLVS